MNAAAGASEAKNTKTGMPPGEPLELAARREIPQ